MKRSIVTIIICVIILVMPVSTYAHDDLGKRFYTNEEIKDMCGVPYDPHEVEEALARQKIMYAEYKENKLNGVYKAATVIPDWKSMMSPIENQGSCGSCWAHAGTGVAEGLLHYIKNSNIGIDLDEMEIVNNNRDKTS